MKIRLNEIPEEGQNYDYSRQTAELNEILADLIQKNEYKVNLFIRPLNPKDFVVTGGIKAKSLSQCSRCAEDFDQKIDKKLNEILIPAQEQDRTGKYTKSSVNISNDGEDISVTEYHKKEFDLGEFIHEAVALEIPFVNYCPSCTKTEDDSAFIYDEKMGEETKPNPFQALKGIKLN